MILPNMHRFVFIARLNCFIIRLSNQGISSWRALLRALPARQVLCKIQKKKMFFRTNSRSQILPQSVCQISPTRFFAWNSENFYSNPTTSYIQCKSTLSIPKQIAHTQLWPASIAPTLSRQTLPSIQMNAKTHPESGKKKCVGFLTLRFFCRACWNETTGFLKWASTFKTSYFSRYLSFLKNKFQKM